jgi:hypothetical protein
MVAKFQHVGNLTNEVELDQKAHIVALEAQNRQDKVNRELIGNQEVPKRQWPTQEVLRGWAHGRKNGDT